MDALIDDIIRREGGYIDHPADRGGPTNYGITGATLSAWRGRPVGAAEIRALTRGEAAAIYAERYIAAPGLDRVAGARLRRAAVDAAVLHGPRRAVCWLQEIAGVPVDGVLGPKTARALNHVSEPQAVAAMTAKRCRFIAAIVASDATQLPFLRGWIARATMFLEELC